MGGRRRRPVLSYSTPPNSEASDPYGRERTGTRFMPGPPY